MKGRGINGAHNEMWTLYKRFKALVARSAKKDSLLYFKLYKDLMIGPQRTIFKPDRSHLKIEEVSLLNRMIDPLDTEHYELLVFMSALFISNGLIWHEAVKDQPPCSMMVLLGGECVVYPKVASYKEGKYYIHGDKGEIEEIYDTEDAGNAYKPTRCWMPIPDVQIAFYPRLVQNVSWIFDLAEASVLSTVNELKKISNRYVELKMKRLKDERDRKVQNPGGC